MIDSWGQTHGLVLLKAAWLGPGVVRPPSAWAGLLLVRVVVLLAGNGFEPGGGVAAVGPRFEHGEVAHERVGRGAVPVLLAGRADDGVAGPDAQDGAVTGADEADTVGDVQGLADGVGVPVGAGAGR